MLAIYSFKKILKGLVIFTPNLLSEHILKPSMWKNMSKLLSALFVTFLAVSILMTVNFAYAQSIPKPSVPEFTVEPVGPSFDVPPTYSFNSSSGLFYINEGYHFEFSSVKVIIKNQPFINQTNFDFFYYNVRIKPHNYPDSYWQELFPAGVDGYPIQASSDYTIIPLPVEGSKLLGTTIPSGTTTDIQVEALIGHIGRDNTGFPYPYVFIGETSGWSNTQTVTLPPKIPFTFSITPATSFTPDTNSMNSNSITLPLSSFISILAFLAVTLVALSVVALRRHRKNT